MGIVDTAAHCEGCRVRDEIIYSLRAETEHLAATACIHLWSLDAASDHDTVICGYDKLRAENEALRKLAKEAADEIEAYVDAVYPTNDRSLYPDQQRRYMRDMDLVYRISVALSGEGEK